MKPIKLAWFSALCLYGCGGTSGPASSDPDGPLVRGVNSFSPAMELTISPSGTTSANLHPGSANEYVLVPAGAETVTFANTATGGALVTRQISAEKGHNYTVFALRNDASAGLQPTSFVLDDARSSVPAAADKGFFTTRFVNGLLTTASVDWYVVSPGSSISGANPKQVDNAFQSGTPYFDITPGSYDLYATQAGTQSVVASAKAFSMATDKLSTFALVSDGLGGATIINFAP